MKIDYSLLAQFALFTGIFFALKVLLFNKLLFVITHRESKTTKLEEEANQKFDQASKLAQEYKEMLGEVMSETSDSFRDQKQQILSAEDKKFKEVEDKVLADGETDRKKIIETIEEKKKAILANADQLADGLVKKLVQ